MLAEHSLHRVGVLPARIFSSVRNAFANIHACESAALTRLCGRAACVVQGVLPHCWRLGPHNFDPFPSTITLRVILSARQHSVQVGMKVRFTPRPACTCRPLTFARCSIRCSTESRGRRVPSLPSRTSSRASPRLVAARFSTITCSSRAAAAAAQLLLGGVEL